MKATITPITEQPTFTERLLLSSGIVAALLYIAMYVLLAGFILPNSPATDAPDALRAAAYAQLSQSMLYAVISVLIQLQMPFLLLFFGGLHSVLHRTEAALANTIFATGMAVALITPLIEFIERHLLLNMAAAGVDPRIVVQFDGFTPMSFGLSALPQAIVLAGVAVLIFNQRFAPRWIGWTGIGLAVFSLAAGAMLLFPQLFPVAALSTILFRLWVLALSCALLRRPQPSLVAPMEMLST